MTDRHGDRRSKTQRTPTRGRDSCQNPPTSRRLSWPKRCPDDLTHANRHPARRPPSSRCRYFAFLRLSSNPGVRRRRPCHRTVGARPSSVDVDMSCRWRKFGVVLLLFIIGLELQPTRLWVMRRLVFGLGSAQVALCTLLLGTAGWLIGLPPTAAFIVGFGLSLSSTRLVLQVLASAGQLKTQHGRSAFRDPAVPGSGVLPVLAVLPLISPLSTTQSPGRPLVADPVQMLVVIAVVIIGGGRAAATGPRYASSRACGSQGIYGSSRCSRYRNRAARQSGRLVDVAGRLSGRRAARRQRVRHELEADSSRSRDCCSACSSSPSACPPISACSSRSRSRDRAHGGFFAIKLIRGCGARARDANTGDRPAWRLGFSCRPEASLHFVLFTARGASAHPRQPDVRSAYPGGDVVDDARTTAVDAARDAPDPLARPRRTALRRHPQSAIPP